MNPWLSEAWSVLRQPLVAPLALTALAGAIAYIAARRAPRVARAVSLVACGAALGYGWHLLAGPHRSFEAVWLTVHEFRLTVALVNEPFGALIAVGAAFFGLAIALYALASERGTRGEGRFHAFLCWTLTGAFGAALADDLLWLLICWELVSLSLYMLLSLGRGDAPAGAAKTFGMLGLGDGAMLLAIAILGATQGTFRISALAVDVGAPLPYAAYLLFLAAALAKAGAVPLHTWVPAAAPSASAAAYALLPGALDKLLGAYLLLRVSFGLFAIDASLQVVVMVIGAVTILGGAVMALLQADLKKLIAFQAVASTGYIVLGVGTGSPIALAGALFHALNGALYQACLFLAAGVVERHAGPGAPDRPGSLARALPATFVCTLLAALAISGVPPLNGFVSKWLIYQGCLAEGSTLALLCLVAAVFGSALTLASFVKVLATVFFGPAAAPAAGPEPWPARAARLVPMGVLALLCVAFGVLPQWPLQKLVLPALAGTGLGAALEFGGPQLQAAELGLWAPVPATMLIVLGLLGGAGLYVLGRVAAVRVTDTFVGGERPADLPAQRVPATGFYRTISDLPGLGAALRDGERSALDVYRLGGQCGGALVSLLRNQHTGVLSLYVSWCLVGVVVIVVYLMAVA